MKYLFFVINFFIASLGFAQKGYVDSMHSFIKNYVETHELVKGDDKAYMKFYPIDARYKVVARFMPSTTAGWISFPTSGKQKQVYKLYGKLLFTLSNKACQLNLYQSQDLMNNEQYKNYLFLPFTDASNGKVTYISGRYIDLTTDDIKNNKVVIDFNKAYNPYCAYVSGVYNCPIPPKENNLAIAVKAGEKAFGKKH